MKTTTPELIFLSHPWGPSCPAYGGGARVEVKPMRSFAAGDTCNTLEFKGSNHIGTHFDFPAHFDRNGKNVLDYPPEFFLHKRILLFWLQLEQGKLLSPPDIKNELRNYDGPYDETLLLIRFGTARYRNTDQFWQAGPGIASGVAEALRENFKQLNTVGLDSISISSMHHRETGRQVHKEFLCHQRPLLIIEDMSLEALASRTPRTVTALPLRLEDADGAPCTVIAEL